MLNSVNNLRGYLIVGTCAWLSACSSAQRQPDWVDQPATAYPEQTHLTAVGMADDRETAGDRALSNLAKIFEVAVTENSLDFSSATVAAAGEQRSVENEQTVTRSVSTTVAQVIEGARVPEYWQSEQGRVYALAALNRAAAAGRFRQSILAQDREVNNLISYATNQADNPIAAIRALQAARDIQVLRDEDNQRLMIITDGQAMNGRYDLTDVDELIRQSLATLKVSVDAPDPTVRAELEQALSALGVQTVDRSNLVLGGVADFAPLENKQGWYWLRGSYELSFLDGGTVLAKQRWPVKVSSTEPNLVAQRARDEINRQLPNYVYELLSATSD